MTYFFKLTICATLLLSVDARKSFADSPNLNTLDANVVRSLEQIKISPKTLPKTTSVFLKELNHRLVKEKGLKIRFSIAAESIEHFNEVLNSSPKLLLGILNDYDKENPFATFSMMKKDISAYDVIISLSSVIRQCSISEDKGVVTLRELGSISKQEN